MSFFENETLNLGTALNLEINPRKRKEAVNKELICTEEMLLNIFEGASNQLVVDIDETDPLRTEDYEGYFRIKDMVDSGNFPKEELVAFYNEYKNREIALMGKWWSFFTRS